MHSTYTISKLPQGVTPLRQMRSHLYFLPAGDNSVPRLQDTETKNKVGEVSQDSVLNGSFFDCTEVAY